MAQSGGAVTDIEAMPKNLGFVEILSALSRHFGRVAESPSDSSIRYFHDLVNRQF